MNPRLGTVSRLIDVGDYRRAMRECEALLRIDPSQAQYHHRLAQAALAYGDGRMALTAAEHAVHNAPTRVSCLEMKGRVHSRHPVNSVALRGAEFKAAVRRPVSPSRPPTMHLRAQDSS